MKPIYFIAILFFALCTNKTKTENIEIVNQLFEHFNDHEWQKMADLYIENGEFKDPSMGIEAISMSRQDVVNKNRALHQMFPDIHDRIIAIYPSGTKHVIVEFISTGKAPDGTSFKLPICTIFTIENGKITKDYTYYDDFG